ncbi:sem1-like protein [Grosmannia clavigera kw1407]|uniref:26S proteasome complex subunit SEM1 n=1 Tax=Grosmannia clavigera (strain kw1407 / UAMH 11150) TaxID=655863 RepID=F0XL47_GROCL|nr:sem1-like protein [Grosmannia clavigera kw1407]EFX01827.1 sem1-like protein [Grosmannia clavigera kw1407]
MAPTSNSEKGSERLPISTSEQKPEQHPPKSTALEEDDEFEDFPVDDWSVEETEAASEGATKHLWDESWDDDDTSDDFSAQLKEELKKVDASKRR